MLLPQYAVEIGVDTGDCLTDCLSGFLFPTINARIDAGSFTGRGPSELRMFWFAGDSPTTPMLECGLEPVIKFA
jgi:hypothetical protein